MLSMCFLLFFMKAYHSYRLLRHWVPRWWSQINCLSFICFRSCPMRAPPMNSGWRLEDDRESRKLKVLFLFFPWIYRFQTRRPLQYSWIPLYRIQEKRKSSNNGCLEKVPNFFLIFLCKKNSANSGSGSNGNSNNNGKIWRSLEPKHSFNCRWERERERETDSHKLTHISTHTYTHSHTPFFTHTHTYTGALE